MHDQTPLPLDRLSTDTAETRMDSLDRVHCVTGVYRQLDRAQAKQRAKLAFVAHEAAVRAGNQHLAAATKTRFLEASAELARRRTEAP